MLQGGSLTLNGQTPLQLGVTKWRTLVTYVPQTRVHPKGTPAEFYFAAQVSLHVLCCILITYNPTSRLSEPGLMVRHFSASAFAFAYDSRLLADPLLTFCLGPFGLRRNAAC